jgi:type VI secretion system protein VasG
VELCYDEDVVKLVASRCTEPDSGGRMIDAILTNTVLPQISREFLTRLSQGATTNRVTLAVESGDFRYGFE